MYNEKLASFLAARACSVCNSRVCDRKGDCDPNAQIDRAILGIASFVYLIDMDHCLTSTALDPMSSEQRVLAWTAATILAKDMSE